MQSSVTPSQFDIDAIILSAKEGDKDAFAKIYDIYFDPIYRYVYFRAPAIEADDLVEVIFIKAWMNLEKYEKRDVQFSAWLFKIAHNTLIDHLRTHRSIQPVDDEMEDKSDKQAPKVLTEKNIMGKVVRDAVSKLKEPYRQVVTLKFLTGLSNEEIAEVLGEREGNVRVLQFRALKELKKTLAETGVKQEFL
ncbi:MAG: sigma-70 family RNA polymerase sigma factor [Candidatus Gracilibacteria bacterium]